MKKLDIDRIEEKEEIDEIDYLYCDINLEKKRKTKAGYFFKILR
ncbi:MAG: hypothetical protein ACFFG0_49725 [Candidatus Thorarchaeota archaeon]